MLSHKLQISGNTLLHRAEWRCREGACSLPGSLALGVLPASISKHQKSTECLQAISFPPAEDKVPLIQPLYPPKYMPLFFACKVCSLKSCWWGQRVQSEGTTASPGKDWPGMLLQVKPVLWPLWMGPLHCQHQLRRVPLGCTAHWIQCYLTFWRSVKKHKGDNYSLK